MRIENPGEVFALLHIISVMRSILSGLLLFDNKLYRLLNNISHSLSYSIVELVVCMEHQIQHAPI